MPFTNIDHQFEGDISDLYQSGHLRVIVLLIDIPSLISPSIQIISFDIGYRIFNRKNNPVPF